MQRHIPIAALVAGMLFLAGCQTALTAPANPILNNEAQAALVWAESDVKKAQSQGALWTTADSALKAAREAAARGDSETVIKNAKNASTQAKLGLEQKNYPAMTFSSSSQ